MIEHAPFGDRALESSEAPKEFPTDGPTLPTSTPLPPMESAAAGVTSKVSAESGINESGVNESAPEPQAEESAEEGSAEESAESEAAADEADPADSEAGEADSSEGGPEAAADPAFQAKLFSQFMERTRAEVGRLQEELRRRDNEIAQWREDYERLRSSLPKRVDDAVRRKREDALSGLLDLCDGLDRALDLFARPPADAPVAAFADRVKGGMESLRELFLRHLDREGIQSIDAAGKSFDPHEHEAVGTLPHPDAEEGTVVAVARRGFRMGDRVVRPATVLVAAPRAGGQG